MFLLESVLCLCDFKLFVVGQGKLLFEIKEFLKNNKLEKNIKLLGRISEKELVEYYNKADFLVVPSIFEGFGLTVIEAMACKTPVIATNVSGIKDIVNKKNGILVDYGNKDKMAEAIKNLLSKKSLRDKLSKAGFKTVIKSFDLDKSSYEIFSIYKKFSSKNK